MSAAALARRLMASGAKAEGNRLMGLFERQTNEATE